VAQFEVKVYRATSGRILDPDGQPFVNGVLVLPDGRRIPTGTAGDFVVEGEAPAGTARVERPGARHSGCTVRFPEPTPNAPGFVRWGALPCTP
jgi:outer membrane usher protein FimD/PapC